MRRWGSPCSTSQWFSCVPAQGCGLTPTCVFTVVLLFHSAGARTTVAFVAPSTAGSTSRIVARWSRSLGRSDQRESISQPDAPIPSRAKLTDHHCIEHIGLIWVALEDPVTPPPQFPAWADDRFRAVVCPPYDWNCHASRRVENFLDFAHFAWVHPGTLGDRDHPEVPDHEVSIDIDVLKIAQPRPEPRNDSVKTGGLDADAEHTEDGRVMSMMYYEAFAPLAAHLRQELPGQREYAVFLSASPIDDHTTRTFWHVARTYDLDQGDETFIKFQQDVVEQDRAIVESQRPEKIPPEVVAELHVRDDKVSLAWRRLIGDLAARIAAD